MLRAVLTELAGLLKAAARNWVADYAQSMGAALAFYTMFAIAPLLLIVISVAGLVFGEEAARGEINVQLEGLLGTHGAVAVQGLLESAGHTSGSVLATVFGSVLLFIGATSVFAELQDALDRIWRAPTRSHRSGLWNLVRVRLLSFGMIDREDGAWQARLSAEAQAASGAAPPWRYALGLRPVHRRNAWRKFAASL